MNDYIFELLDENGGEFLYLTDDNGNLGRNSQMEFQATNLEEAKKLYEDKCKENWWDKGKKIMWVENNPHSPTKTGVYYNPHWRPECFRFSGLMPPETESKPESNPHKTSIYGIYFGVLMSGVLMIYVDSYVDANSYISLALVHLLLGAFIGSIIGDILRQSLKALLD